MVPCPQSTSKEVVVALPNDAGCLALSTRGQTALRLRILAPGAPTLPFESPMIAPDMVDLPFSTLQGTGISSKIGSMTVDADGVLTLYHGPGTALPLMTSLPIQLGSSPHMLTFTAPVPQRLYGGGGGPSRDGTSKGCDGGPEPAELATTSSVLPRVENCAGEQTTLIIPMKRSAVESSRVSIAQSTRRTIGRRRATRSSVPSTRPPQAARPQRAATVAQTCSQWSTAQVTMANPSSGHGKECRAPKST